MRHDNHLLVTVTLEIVTSEMITEDHVNETCLLGHTENLVTPNGNNTNSNNNMNINMLNTSDDVDDLEYEMSDIKYDVYYHVELFVEYNSHPTPKQVHNKDLAPII